MDWASFEAGALPKPEFIVNETFDEDYFTETREKRLASLLVQDVVDNEEMWINYDSDETEVQLDLADMILEQLVFEAVNGLTSIEDRRKKCPI